MKHSEKITVRKCDYEAFFQAIIETAGVEYLGEENHGKLITIEVGYKSARNLFYLGQFFTTNQNNLQNV